MHALTIRSDLVSNEMILPVFNVRRGRPRTRRIESQPLPLQRSTARNYTCSLCKQIGHNKRNC